MNLCLFQVCLCTNPIWLVKTRLQLQTPLHQGQPYSGFHGLLPFHINSFMIFCDFHHLLCIAWFLIPDALKTILREEGWTALYRGLMPSLFLVKTILSFCCFVHNILKTFSNFSVCCRCGGGLKGKCFLNSSRHAYIFTRIQSSSFFCCQQVTHGAIQFTTYEELKKVFINLYSQGNRGYEHADSLLVSHPILHDP